MKIIIFLFSVIFSIHSFANNIIVNGTRFIYPGNDKEITVQMSNSADRPAIAQVWLDNGNPLETPDTIKTPFQITPPISRIEAKTGQALRIKLIDKAVIATDRESLWWLNILDIPPVNNASNKADSNVLQLAIRSRFKFFYRPTGLGNPDKAVNQLMLTTKGQQLVINNPTPFYITITKIYDDTEISLNSKALMLAPKSIEIIQLTKGVKPGTTLTIDNINDYGANISRKVTVK